MKYHLAIDESLGYIGPFRNKATLVESPEDCAELHELPGVDQLEHRYRLTRRYEEEITPWPTRALVILLPSTELHAGPHLC